MFTDYELCKRYVNKVKSSEDRGIAFELSFSQFKRILSAKKCQLSGLELNSDNITLDRVDSSKGYVTGNVVACDKTINQMKGVLENPTHPITIKVFAKALNKSLKIMEKQ